MADYDRFKTAGRQQPDSEYRHSRKKGTPDIYQRVESGAVPFLRSTRIFAQETRPSCMSEQARQEGGTAGGGTRPPKSRVRSRTLGHFWGC